MPRRGEVWLVDLGMALRGSEFEIAVDVPFLKRGAFVVQSLITIPSKLALRKLGGLTPAQLAPVEQGVRRWLGL
jgi:mRNA interferase MazF